MHLKILCSGVLSLFVFLTSCATQHDALKVDCSDDPCALSKSVCDEARDFQKEYQRMEKEEQHEMVGALNTYIGHCEKMRAQCDECSKK